MRKSLIPQKVLHIVAGIALLVLFPGPAKVSAHRTQTVARDWSTENGNKSGLTKTGWSGATAISPVSQPDPTRGSQLNDVAVNANGLAVAAWDQFTYAVGGPYTIGVAVQSGGRWGAPFTISGTTGFSISPKVAV